MSDPGLVVENDVMVAMRDGVRLRADVFRPAGVEDRLPVLVLRNPYSTRDGIWAMLGQAVAQQGYAVVVQSCRGRYGSEGDFSPIHADVEDGYDTVEWAAAQPWSNGAVGMYGLSYSGMAAWAAAIARPPHLVAIAPLSSMWDWSGHGAWYAAPGVLALGMALNWSAGATVWEAERRGVAPPLPAFAEAERLSDEAGYIDREARAKVVELQTEATWPLFEHRPLRDLEGLRELAPWFRDWCDHDDPQDPYWRSVSPAEHVAELDLPILNLTGWFDCFRMGPLEAFSTMARAGMTEATRRGQRLVVGPWNHMAGQNRPDADPGVDLFLDVSPGSPMMRFFGHHLKGEDPDYDTEPPVRLYVMGENRWREEHEWPLARTVWTPWFLHADGELSTTSPGAETPDSFVYDPADPAPGSIAIGSLHNDTVDLDAVGRRSDVLVYTTPPVSADLEITGPVSVDLWASSSVESTDFTAKLIEVFADGQAVTLCQGVVRTGVGVAHPRTPGAAYCHEIDLWATSVVVKAGHRLQLQVSSSEYPTYDLNPNTGSRITHDSGETVPATQHVFHDELHPSRLILPVIPREGEEEP